jgi:uncharacterized protein YbjT (DUF2867 family)
MKNHWVVVTGATGHVGRRVAERLLAEGRRVRVIGRNAERLAGLVKLGAEPVVGSVEDVRVVKKALKDAQAAFLMMPPNPTAGDFRMWQDRVADNYATSLREAGTPFAVTLSSVGGHLAQGTGPIVGLHHLEEALNAIRSLNAMHLRPAFFMENHLYGIPAIRASDLMVGYLRPDLSMAMIATADIGGAAADQLLRPGFQGHSTRELLGQRDLTMEEAARVLGTAIGRPGLRYMQAPYEAAEKAMTDMGMSGNVAHLMTEMGRAFNEGVITPREARSALNTTPTSIEDFARRVFEPAFRLP